VLILLSLTRTMGFTVPAWHMAIRRRAE
jgi:hypothetical protein